MQSYKKKEELKKARGVLNDNIDMVFFGSMLMARMYPQGNKSNITKEGMSNIHC